MEKDLRKDIIDALEGGPTTHINNFVREMDKIGINVDRLFVSHLTTNRIIHMLKDDKSVEEILIIRKVK